MVVTAAPTASTMPTVLVTHRRGRPVVVDAAVGPQVRPADAGRREADDGVGRLDDRRVVAVLDPDVVGSVAGSAPRIWVLLRRRCVSLRRDAPHPTPSTAVVGVPVVRGTRQGLPSPRRSARTLAVWTAVPKPSEFLVSRRAKVTPRPGRSAAGRQPAGARVAPQRSRGARRAERRVLHQARTRRVWPVRPSRCSTRSLGRCSSTTPNATHLAHLAEPEDGAEPSQPASRRRVGAAANRRPSLQWMLDAVTGGAGVRPQRPHGPARRQPPRPRLLRRRVHRLTPPTEPRPVRVPGPGSASLLRRLGRGGRHRRGDPAHRSRPRPTRPRTLHDLVGELSTRSPEFRTRWARHDVRHHGIGHQTIRPPRRRRAHRRLRRPRTGRRARPGAHHLHRRTRLGLRRTAPTARLVGSDRAHPAAQAIDVDRCPARRTSEWHESSSPDPPPASACAAAHELIALGHDTVFHARNRRTSRVTFRRAQRWWSATSANPSKSSRLADQINAVSNHSTPSSTTPASTPRRDASRTPGSQPRSWPSTCTPRTCSPPWSPVRAALVYLSSDMHTGGSANVDDLNWAHVRWNGTQAYCDSKLLVTTLAFAIARRWPDVRSNAVDPGWVPTRMGGPSRDRRLGARPPNPGVAGRPATTRTPPSAAATGTTNEPPAAAAAITTDDTSKIDLLDHLHRSPASPSPEPVGVPPAGFNRNSHNLADRGCVNHTAESHASDAFLALSPTTRSVHDHRRSVRRQDRVRHRRRQRHRSRHSDRIRTRWRTCRRCRPHRVEHSRNTVAAIEQLGGRAIAVGCDVTRSDDIVAASSKPSIRSGGSTSRSTTPASLSPRTRRRHHRRRMGPNRQYQSPRRLPVHEAPDPAHARDGGRCHRQHLIRCRRQGLRQRRRLRCIQVRCHRPHQMRCPRLRRVQASESTPSAPASSTPT